MSIACFERSRMRAIVPFSVWFFSRVTRKLTQTSSTQTAGSRSESYGKVPLSREEGDGTDEEEAECPGRSTEDVRRRGPLRSEDLLDRGERRVQRVEAQV